MEDKKQEFWDALRMPVEADRNCSNCLHGGIDTKFRCFRCTHCPRPAGYYSPYDKLENLWEWDKS